MELINDQIKTPVTIIGLSLRVNGSTNMVSVAIIINIYKQIIKFSSYMACNDAHVKVLYVGVEDLKVDE